MKYRAKIWPITWRYLLFALIIVLAVAGLSFSVFFKVNQETGAIELSSLDVPQIIIIVAMGLALVGFYFLSIFTYYYEIDKHSFVMKRLFKTYEFEYKNIEFIDEENSKRKNLIIFYSKTAKMRYLIADREGKVLETLIKKCPDSLSLEEFRRAHPEEKY